MGNGTEGQEEWGCFTDVALLVGMGGLLYMLLCLPADGLVGIVDLICLFWGERFMGLCCLWTTTKDRSVKIISYEERRIGKGGGDGLREKFAAVGVIGLIHW